MLGERATVLDAPTTAMDRRRRILTGIAVVVVIMLLDGAARFLLSPNRARAASYAVVWGIEVPVTLVTLGVWYGFAQRRRWGALRTLLTTASIAGFLGVVFGVGVCLLAQRYSAFRYNPERAPTLGRAIAFGFVFGQLHAGLWAMAFVYPF